jgi:hypothetical protein
MYNKNVIVDYWCLIMKGGVSLVVAKADRRSQ